MPDILIRDLDKKTILRLKKLARQNGRSLQCEAKMVLERAAGAGRDQILEMLDRWKQRLAGRRFSDSAALIRKDRDR